ncbi:MAG: gliding motility protein GldN [Crocinitomicaceae bacterium]|jgi:gliding motility associated protien GldN|nr:gliding motility protein GldN [Crocinitomicaceae bacterium]
MNIKQIISVSFTVVAFVSANAQLPSSGMSESGVLDGVYVQEHVPTKRVIQYTALREADIVWAKRVWRTIDLREKKNHPLTYPTEPISDRRSLWDVIKYGVMVEKSLTPYKAMDDFGYANDQFDIPLVPPNGNVDDPVYQEELNALFFNSETQPVLDDDGLEVYDLNGDPVDTVMTEAITSDAIIKYYIKEDWFFDKQRGVQERRIIGIAPVRYSLDDNGDIKALNTMFWLYFPECRYVFQNFFVYNSENDARRMSYDDLFWKQMYTSYIHKESNVYDRKVNNTFEGVDALLESEKIKKEIFTLEHDLWHL